MTSTERLRALLNERGIEHDKVDRDASHYTYWDVGGVRYKYSSYGDSRGGCLSICCANFLTPEQAIAATVGIEPDEATMLKLHSRMNAALLDMNEELLAYHQHDRENASSKELIDCVIRAHQIIEDAATVGVGTCQIETTESWLPAERYHRCKHCGAFFAVLDASHDIPPRVCPNCGKRITKEEDA